MSSNYERFVLANSALMQCYAAVSAEQYSAMNKTEQVDVCKSEASAVREHIQLGHADFRNILAERIASLEAGQK